jgi:hypothetical protein
MTIGGQDHPDKHADVSADHQNGRQKISSFGRRVRNWLTRCTRYICKRITIILCWSVYPFSVETIPQYLIASFTLTLAIFAYYAWDEATRGTAALKEQAKTLQGQLDEMKAEARPWVTALNKIETMQPLTFDDSGANFYIGLRMKNGGKSFATRIVPLVEPFVKPLPADLAQGPNGTIIKPRGKFAASQCTQNKGFI